MRIDGTNNREKFFKGNLDVIKDVSKVGFEQSLSENLHKIEKAQLEQKFDELLKQLDLCGKRLVKSFTLKDYKTYRETLQGFLKETIGKAFSLKEERGWNRHSKQVIYQSITKIDEKLEELANIVMNEQKDSVNLVSKMAEIKGLLFDIYS